MTAAPPLRFPDRVRADLDAHRPGLADEWEAKLVALARPCVAITAKRVSSAPLRRHPVARLFGAGEAQPVLDVTASKFGGAPYSEGNEPWSEHRFLGQIALAEATSVLPPGAIQLSGLLRIDLASADTFDEEPLRVRWFRDFAPSRAVPVSVPSVGKWETRLELALAWTLPEGRALEALWPLRDPKTQWYEYDELFPAPYNRDGHDEFHRLLGHKSSGLDEPYGFTPPPGCGEDIESYECLLRLTYDNAAGFAWGTNWIYLLVPREDLSRGDLSRVVVTGANT